MPIKIDLYDYLRFHKSIPHQSNYPVITNVAASVSGLITWTTDVPATSQVLYGLVPYLGFITPLDSTLTTSHSVQLNSLSNNTLYYFKVQSFRIDALSISDLYTFLTVSVPVDFSAYSVTNFSNDTSFDADNTSLDELANVLGSIITLFKTGVFNLSTFTATNVTTTHSFDAASASMDQIADVIGSLIASLTPTGSSTDIYTPSNVTVTITYDASNTSFTELSNVLGSVILTLKGAGKLQ